LQVFAMVATRQCHALPFLHAAVSRFRVLASTLG